MRDSAGSARTLEVLFDHRRKEALDCRLVGEEDLDSSDLRVFGDRDDIDGPEGVDSASMLDAHVGERSDVVDSQHPVLPLKDVDCAARELEKFSQVLRYRFWTLEIP